MTHVGEELAFCARSLKRRFMGGGEFIRFCFEYLNGLFEALTGVVEFGAFLFQEAFGFFTSLPLAFYLSGPEFLAHELVRHGDSEANRVAG